MSRIHVVVLSGRSGTRLWPLSTNTRPKQFLKVLRDEQNHHVSMMQRVLGQIRHIPADVDVTVITSAIYKDYLDAQLSDTYAVVVEPQQRNTAPAIMLACAHLSLVQKAAPDDTVIVTPIDAYTDQSFYDCFPLLDTELHNRSADLILLGVKPNYPSDRYGYILPARTSDALAHASGTTRASTSQTPLRVRAFKEKPTREEAQLLITEGGLWNCGVFAFQLHYLTQITDRYFHSDNFEELRAHYTALPRISFDYEVVEKAASAMVIPYEGAWTDLGTWNSLTSKMAETTAGRVTLDSATCNNVHVVNETNVPLVVAGISNAAVVATPDGILVTGKDVSAHIKDLIQEARLSRPMYDRRPWGEYRVLAADDMPGGPNVITQELIIKTSATSKPQSLSHEGYSELWTVVAGSGRVAIDGKQQDLYPGDALRIPVGASILVRATTDLHIIDVRVPEGVNPFLDVQGEWKRWQERASACSELLLAIANNKNEIADAFCRDVSFGTGGIRQRMGAGPNRLNVYTVARATQGVADWVWAKQNPAINLADIPTDSTVSSNTATPTGSAARYQTNERPCVAIARDTRYNSDTFARVCAEVLAANGIIALIYSNPTPTPTLSFAVRALGCAAGIVITASHNRAEYNGYKVYDADGCQITTENAQAIAAYIAATDTFDDVERTDFAAAQELGLIHWIDQDILSQYKLAVLAQALAVDPVAKKNLRVVYTPLNGTGAAFVPDVLAQDGFSAVSIVPEQYEPDPDFTTCPYPNPEFPKAWERAQALALKYDADIALANDPDADRAGLLTRHALTWRLLSGNDVGVLLLDWLCRRELAAGRQLKGRIVVTTIVTAPMADALAERYGFELRRTLTGFKYIGEQIGVLAHAGQEERFLFGLEESIGYLKGTYVRDKDGVLATLLAAELAAECKSSGTDLIEQLTRIGDEVGHFATLQLSVPYPGIDGPTAMRNVVSRLRKASLHQIGGIDVVRTIDYIHGAPMPVLNALADEPAQTLPPSNVLQWDLTGGSRMIVRPSGTEPKLKCYLFARAASLDEAETILARLKDAAHVLLNM